MVIAIAGAALLALVVVMQRRGAAAATPTSAAQDAVAADPAYSAAGGLPAGSTFADNGESMSGLSDALTQGLGAVQTSLDNVGVALQGMQSLNEAQPGSTSTDTNAAAGAPPPITINLNTGASSPAKKTAAAKQAAPAKPKVDARGHTAAQRAAIRKKDPAAATAYQKRLANKKKKK